MSISNQERGDANHAAIVAYFDGVKDVPLRPDGTADVSRIVRDIPLGSRGIIYQNKRNREAVNAGLAKHNIPPLGEKVDETAGVSFQRPGAVTPDKEKQQLRQRVGQLERELVARGGEVAELRRQLRRYTAIDNHMAETGRLPR